MLDKKNVLDIRNIGCPLFPMLVDYFFREIRKAIFEANPLGHDSN
jgi:hypothetical protein